MRDTPGRSLTPHQWTVLRLLSHGYEYSEIGARLGIGVDTVKSHVRALYRRLGVNNSGYAVRVGMERGLLRPFEVEPTDDELPTTRGRTTRAYARVPLDENDEDEGESGGTR